MPKEARLVATGLQRRVELVVPRMLRLLHTADWHLGQLLRERERADEHRNFLAWLLSVIRERPIDGLLISGDVFDVANPPASAQRMLYEFVVQARSVRPAFQLVAIAGNHDSPSRLEAPGPMAASLGATIIGRVPWKDAAAGTGSGLDLDALLVPLRNAEGLNEAWCLAVPYLRPGDVPPVEGERDHYARGIALLYQQLTARALELRQPGQAIVAMGHLTALGERREPRSSRGDATDPIKELENEELENEELENEELENEELENEAIRPILLGGLERLSERIFPEAICYVALGHLHRAGHVGPTDRIRYSGSPIPLSYAERGYRHRVVYLEIESGCVQRIESLEIPRYRSMLRIPNTVRSLPEVVAALREWTPSAEERLSRIWLEVPVDIEARHRFDVMAQIEEVLRDKPIYAWRFGQLEQPKHERRGEQLPLVGSLDEVMRMLEPTGLLLEAWRRTKVDSPLPSDVNACLQELLQADGEA